MSHMFKGGFTPWKVNPHWREQAKEFRLAEEARQKKQTESSGGGDIIVRIAMILAGAGFVSLLFGNPPPPG